MGITTKSSPITIPGLVSLANLRRIPSQLDRAWEQKTCGTNPVVVARRIHESKARLPWLFVAIGAFIAMLLGTISLAGNEQRFLTLPLLQGVLLGWLTIASLVRWLGREGSSQEEIRSAEKFCSDLSKFCEWSGIGPYEFEIMGWERLKQDAGEILIKEAEQVLQHEKTNRDMSEKYDPLLRLGLVAEGGYAKYFAEAEERIKFRNLSTQGQG